MATVNQDPNQPTLDAIDSMFNGLRSISPFNDIGSILSPEVPQEMDPGNGQIQPVGYIAPGAIDVSDIFVSTLMPPEVVSVLPTLPDTTYPEGRLVFLTTDGKLWRNVADEWTVEVDGADIKANSIEAGSIVAGAIGADQLASNIILGGLIIAGDPDAAHLELDSDGLRAFDESLNLLLNAPTDGEPLYVNAEVEARSLTVTGDAVFQGTANEFAISSVTQLQAQQTPPTQAPSLSQGWASISLPVDSVKDQDATHYTRQGLFYDAAGGLGGATKVFWQVSMTENGQAAIVELLASDRTINREQPTVLDMPDECWRPSICRFSDWVYVYYADFLGNSYVIRYLASNLNFVDQFTSINLPGSLARPQDHYITSDGTDIYIVGPNEFGVIKWNRYNATMVKQGTTTSTGLAPEGSTPGIAAAYAGSADLGAFRIIVLTDFGGVYSFDSSGTEQTGESFELPGLDQYPSPTRGLTYGDALGDGARFWSMGAIDSSTAQTLGKHSTWNWTSGSAKFWVGYTWHDSVGGYETTVGPRASITMGKRKQLIVTTQAAPAGVTGRRIYMERNASAPATTALDLQTTSTTASATLTGYNSSGGAPPVTNSFPAGTAAQIKSATAGWFLKGDGTASFASVASVPFTDITAEDITLTGGLNIGDVGGPNGGARLVGNQTGHDYANLRSLNGPNSGTMGIAGRMDIGVSAQRDDWEPANFHSNLNVRVDGGAGNRTITGMVAVAGGELKIISNVGTTNSVILAHQSASSAAANRIICRGAANLTLAVGDSVLLIYDGGSSRWRVLS